MKKTFKIAVLALIAALFITSCGVNQLTVQNGDTVSVHYTGTFENGEKFDSSVDRGVPLDFQVGAGQMISGFDAAVVGMKIWDKKSITLEPKDAYGERDEKNLQVVPKEQLKSFTDAWVKLEKWAILETQIWDIEILDSDETTVTLDWNHPMAGKTLNFDIEMVNITRN